jgi:orotidine-5'-phosphate decarboxylase
MALISGPRSLIPACDVDLEKFGDIVRTLESVAKIGAYKIGMSLGLSHGLSKVVETARRYSQKPLIYDHQKAGTDIPDTGKEFAKVVKKSGVDAVIFFPLAGPATLKAWVNSAFEQELKVLVGCRMTHKNFVRSEGGYIEDTAIEKAYLEAANLGVTDFVVPGNNPGFIKYIRNLLEQADVRNPIFYAPGFIAQKGTISEAAAAAGEKWHAIVGRAIYESQDMRQAAEQLASSI